MPINSVFPAMLTGRINSVAQPTRLEDAAREFEAMLIAQLLKVARKAGELHESEDAMTGGDGYLEIAEQQVARSLADSGVLGLSRMLVRDIERTERTVETRPHQTAPTDPR